MEKIQESLDKLKQFEILNVFTHNFRRRDRSEDKAGRCQCVAVLTETAAVWAHLFPGCHFPLNPYLLLKTSEWDLECH